MSDDAFERWEADCATAEPLACHAIPPNELLLALPSRDVLLGVPVPELAETLLRVANVTSDARGLARLTTLFELAKGYGGGREHAWETRLAIAEGWHWLVTHGLLVPQAEAASQGSAHLSRSGRRVLETGAFRTYAYAIAFPKEQLHPAIRDQVWSELLHDDHAAAAFKAFRAVESAVRDAAGYGPEETGVALVQKAFDPDHGPLADRSQPAVDRDAVCSLFASAMSLYGDPSRGAIDPGRQEAQEIAMLASLLLRIVDSRTGAA